MSDLDHTFGGDLSIAADGDIALARGGVLGQQRVLRRLLTNSGDYIWQLRYGAGLPSMIGMPVEAASIKGIVRNQILLESAVARTPAPNVEVNTNNDIVSLQISYSDANSDSTQSLGLALSA